MVDPINDIARQARQGSVSAIIQILNEKLADSGVRTRAMLSRGILQLLCEAAQPDMLDRSTLVPQVQQILESIQPRGIRQVIINSRIVREQQLLWLEEITRDPDNQLLWSEKITLPRPNPLTGLFRREPDRTEIKEQLPKRSSRRTSREQRLVWRAIGGISVGVLLVAVGWLISDWLNLRQQVAPLPLPASSTPSASTASSPSEPAPDDPFTSAVRLAEEAATIGQSAQTSAEWLNLATKWQQASDLMNQVPPEDGRYTTAQDRVEQYRRNRESAVQQAQQLDAAQPASE